MPPFNNFTTKAKEVIRKAHELAIERGQNHVNTLHLLTALLVQEDSIVVSILDKMEVDTTLLIDNLSEMIESPENKNTISPSYQIYLTPDLAQSIENSSKIAGEMKDNFVSTEHLFISLLEIPGEARELLGKFKISKDKVQEMLELLRKEKGSGVDINNSKKPKLINKFTRNLTSLARQDKLDPVIGREKEIMRMMQILSRRTKNNPILIGEAGTGKTAVAEALAQRIAKNDVPESLKDKEVVSLDLGLLLAGTKYRGEFEERLRGILKEIERSDDKIILFIDEIHTIVGAGTSEGSLDASNMLKPALARGELRAIGATTLKEYQKHIEKDPALARRFQPIFIDEPSVDDTIAILRGLKEKYELFHGVRITDDAIIAAVTLSTRYITNRYLPDKAVDLIDEASSALRIALENKPPVLEDAHRRIMRFEIEKEALMKEVSLDSNKSSVNKKTQSRVKEIEKEISNLKEKTHEIELKWKNEKETVTEIRKIKKDLETLRIEGENAEMQADLSRAAEIRYGEIPDLKKKLDIKLLRLKKLQRSRRILKEEIIAEDIAQVVSMWTSIPLSQMLEEERTKLAKMEEILHNRVIGQNEAIEKISNVIRRNRAGISDPNKPIGSFIFLGPTGVGKTELTKALAQFMFNDDKALIRVDMSEYMERHSVSKLIGSPPGYVGYEESGNLTEAVRHRPYSVILFDEVEKAHPEVFNVLLQVLDEGRLTDAKGRIVNFKNAVIILTSNIGSQFIEKMETLGFTNNSKVDEYSQTKEKVLESLKDYFRPEFLNRIDDIIVFDILSLEAIRHIVDLKVKIVLDRLLLKEIGFEISPEALNYLAKEGYNPHYGARPLGRIIQNKILNPVANFIIGKSVKKGDIVNVIIKDKELVVEMKKKKLVSNVKFSSKVNAK